MMIRCEHGMLQHENCWHCLVKNFQDIVAERDAARAHFWRACEQIAALQDVHFYADEKHSTAKSIRAEIMGAWKLGVETVKAESHNDMPPAQFKNGDIVKLKLDGRRGMVLARSFGSEEWTTKWHWQYKVRLESNRTLKALWSEDAAPIWLSEFELTREGEKVEAQ